MIINKNNFTDYQVLKHLNYCNKFNKIWERSGSDLKQHNF